MPSESGQLPPYQRVAADIRARVVSGELSPGETVPSVRQLSARWGIAHATAAKALDLLRTEGLVESHRGIGMVVREDQPVYRGIRDRYDTVRRTGRIYTTAERAEITAAEITTAPEEAAQALGVSPGASVIRRDRVTLRRDAPDSTSTSWFRADLAEIAPALLARERILEGTLPYVERVTGRSAKYGDDRYCARLATAEEADRLGLQLPAAVLETRHVAYDAAGEPLTYEVGLARPGKWAHPPAYEVHAPNGDTAL
jgi:DNA-binding GntR family transcriptional regulator